MKRGLRRFAAKAPRSFFIIVLLSLALFAGALTLLLPLYETNDDAAMNLYAAGTNLGQLPSEFILFQHFVIGLTLKFLYTHLPQVAWYGGLLYLYLFLSSVIIGYVISRLSHGRSVVGFWVVLFLLFYLQVILGPQFTICAGYLAIAGLLLVYLVIYQPYESQNANRWLLILGVGLLILSCLVRFYSLLLVLLAMAPLYGYLFFTRRADTWRRLLPLLGGVVLLSFFLNWTQLVYYRHSPGWTHFYSYNDVRAEFIDRHKIAWDENTAPLFRRIGWSQNDLRMLTSWFYLEPKLYSFKHLVFISRYTALLPKPKIDWDKLFPDLGASLMSYGGLATLFLCAFVFIRSRGTTRVFGLLALLWYGILFTGVTIVERHLPLRVWMVMLCSLYVMELIFWCRANEESVERSVTRKTPEWLLPVVIASALIFCCWNQIEVIRRLNGDHLFYEKEFREDLAELKPRTDQLFVTWGGDFPYQAFQAPCDAEPASNEMQFLGLGVGNHEPVVQNRLRSFGIKDLYQAFYQRDDIFLICVEMKKEMLAQYIREHYHTEVEVKTIFKGKTFTVCKVTKTG
ncbi:MAG: hypothetical protein H0X40_02740 [Chthoniobacterales bacterium]|nr:hypothetical protein [Chthoniobacterales bacterium]